MPRVSKWRWVWGVIVFCSVTATVSRAQTFTTLASFDGLNGGNPYRVLIQGSDGNFYGITAEGGAKGANGEGTAFKVTPEGKLTTLHNFCTLAQCADGSEPLASLVQASNGKFYGTTSLGGGSENCGTVFEITATGTLTTLHSFDGTDGCIPEAGLIQAANGYFYGTTFGGGTNEGGTIFEMTSAGKLTTLYSFCSLANCADGMTPGAPLVQAADGNFYGTTLYGGANVNGYCTDGCGTIFGITPAGKLKTLYSFCSLPACADGGAPRTPLIQATDRDFYGITIGGGSHLNCFPRQGCGTVFKMTSSGKLRTLHSFSGGADGSYPQGVLVQATDGNFYGTTGEGGAGAWGSAFEITPEGTLTTLYSFDGADGKGPVGFLQATNGAFYGTTEFGGTSDDGTIFSLDTGLSPFVSFIRNPAKIGQQFGILGYGLTGTSTVSFNGISAKFKAQSDTLLVAIVPSGATTGYVTVTTPSGTLTSNVPFRVIR